MKAHELARFVLSFMMHVPTRLCAVVCLTAFSSFAKHIIYDGRAALDLTDADLDASLGPFLTYV